MLLSIITINLNHYDGLLKTVESVVNQTCSSIEYIVIDGGSTDGSAEWLEKNSGHFNYWISENDRGIYNAMNKAVQVASGEFIYFLNSGDIFANAEVSQHIIDTCPASADLFYGNYYRLDAMGKCVDCIHPSEMTVGAFWKKGICQQAIVYNKKVFEKYGLFDETYRIAGDTEMNLRILLGGGHSVYTDTVFVVYEGGGVSAVQKEQHDAEKRRLFEKHLPPAIYHDYVDYRELQREMKHLREWISSLKSRSFIKNLAMISKWWGCKIFRQGPGKAAL